MSATPFLNRFLGTGLALVSLGRARGYSISFGLGFVKLNGFISVTFFYWTSPSKVSPEGAPVSPIVL